MGFISPSTQKNITTKTSATYNFLNSDVDQRHLPSVDKNSVNLKESVQENSYQTNNSSNNSDNKVKLGLTAFNNEKNLRNVAKLEKKERESKTSAEDEIDTRKHARTEPESRVSKSKNEELPKSNGQSSWLKPEFKLNKVSSSISADPTRSMDSKSKTQDYKVPDLVETDTIINSSINKNNKPKDEAKAFEKVDQSVVKPVQSGSVNGSGSAVNNVSVEDSRPIKIIIPKKTKPKKEEATSAVFNFTARTDVPDYISNDTSRVPSRPVIPKVSVCFSCVIFVVFILCHFTHTFKNSYKKKISLKSFKKFESLSNQKTKIGEYIVRVVEQGIAVMKMFLLFVQKCK